MLNIFREIISLNIILNFFLNWNKMLCWLSSDLTERAAPAMKCVCQRASRLAVVSLTVTACHYHVVMSSICAVTKRSALVTHSFILIALISYSLNICSLVLLLTLKKQSLFACLTPFSFPTAVCVCMYTHVCVLVFKQLGHHCEAA